MNRRAVLLGLGGAAVGLAARGETAAAATPIPLPTGSPVLTISGKIRNPNKGADAVFDMTTLEGLGLTSFTTKTPWTPTTKFSGVLLDRLMKRIGAYGTTMVAYALNDYSAELPISDFATYGPILATRMNGKYMPVTDKGPLFVVYPFDGNSDLARQTFYGRCVWQLDRMAIL
ncbi:MAG TPA: molybdopterin-dependent oxidoreductase [Acidisoma sp.]|jgi:hypothetical protein|nr:molybdopterin-dependent oxidoreductase [Acidisoma sp.]